MSLVKSQFRKEARYSLQVKAMILKEKLFEGFLYNKKQNEKEIRWFQDYIFFYGYVYRMPRGYYYVGKLHKIIKYDYDTLGKMTCLRDCQHLFHLLIDEASRNIYLSEI